MTETERRYKILKRTSYQEQISKEEKNATNETLLLGMAAAAALCTFSSAANANTSEVLRLFDIILGIANTCFGAKNLKRLIEAISKKTMLEGKVEDIDMDLAMDEQVPTISKRR